MSVRSIPPEVARFEIQDFCKPYEKDSTMIKHLSLYNIYIYLSSHARPDLSDHAHGEAGQDQECLLRPLNLNIKVDIDK